MLVKEKTFKGISKPVITMEFNGFFDVAKYIESKNKRKYKLYQEIEENKSFHGGVTFDESMTQLKYGIKSLTEYYIDNINLEDKSSTVHMIELKMDIEGSTYDIGAVIQGVPECCIEDDLLPKIKQRVKIYIDLGYSCAASSNNINNRGVAIYNLITNLIRQGYIVEVYAINYYNLYNNDKDVLQITKVTTLNNKPLLPHLAFAGTTQYFRNISWMACSMVCDNPKGDRTWEHARSELPEQIIDDLKKKNIFYIPGGYIDSDMYYCSTIEKANEIVMKHWKKYVERIRGK